jgi:hypothetical protein
MEGFLGTLMAGLIGQPAMRKFSGRIPEAHLLDTALPLKFFAADEGYFRIRLSSMFLRDRREYWRTFLPFTVVIGEFTYRGAKQTVPFLVGNQLLKSLEKEIAGEQVEYHNTNIAGPVPYVGDDVGLFAGLFRSQVDNLAENLFAFLETIVKAFDASKISAYLNIASPLEKGLSSLLGMKQVELRLGNREVFSDKPGVPHQFKEGYLAYVNCPVDAIAADRLWVKEDSLFVGADPTSIQPLREFDHCLVQIEHLVERNDYTTLPFYPLWNDAKSRIYQGDQANARRIFLEMAQQLAVSPDLTQPHRFRLIQAFKANFEKEVALYGELGGVPKGAAEMPTRGSSRGVSKGPSSLSPRAFIQKEASQLAQVAGVPKRVLDGLAAISDRWEKIPCLKERARGIALDDRILNDQVRALGGLKGIKRADPQDLVNALTFSALTPS